MNQAELIHFNKIGKPSEGYLSVAELQDVIPFDVKRIFWTYFTPEDIIRGRHAHIETEMVLIAVAGKIEVNTEMPDGTRQNFILEKPDQGVYMPKMCWHTMKYSHNAVQLVLVSTPYVESDYIRDYEEFNKLKK